MTNRNLPPRMTRSVKKPRLRRVEITFQGSPEPVNNGHRPHGGYRGKWISRVDVSTRSADKAT